MMNWSESESGCKQHPNDKQIPGGVCSSCLREKLAQLCVDSTKKPTQMDHFDTSSLFAQSKHAYSLSSSASYRWRHHRDASDVMVDSVTRNNSSNLGFNKSRSVAFASRSQVRDVKINGVYGRKKTGFWSKLLKFTGKGTKDPLMHSTAITREPKA